MPLETAMTQKRPLGLPSVKLVGIAAIAGILAGAVAVYVKEAGSGNAVASADGGQCEGAVGKAASLKDKMTGQVAAMVAATEPRQIAGLNFTDAADRFSLRAFAKNLTDEETLFQILPVVNDTLSPRSGRRFGLEASVNF